MNLKKFIANFILKVGYALHDLIGIFFVALAIGTILTIGFVILGLIIGFVIFNPIISMLIASMFVISYIWKWAERNK